jgi:hypothetical protein
MPLYPLPQESHLVPRRWSLYVPHYDSAMLGEDEQRYTHGTQIAVRHVLLLLPGPGLAVFALGLTALVLICPGATLLAVRSSAIRVIAGRTWITRRSPTLRDVSGRTLLASRASSDGELPVVTALALTPASLRPLSSRTRLTCPARLGEVILRLASVSKKLLLDSLRERY